MPPGPELLTGDTNIVNVNLILQYVIRDPAEFLFQIKDAAAFVEAAAEAALTETIAGMPVDEVLTRGRVAVQERVKTQDSGGPGSPPQRRLDRIREHHGHNTRPIGGPGVPGCCERDVGPREDDQRGSRLPEQPDPQGARGCAHAAERGRGLQATAHRRSRRWSEPFPIAPEGVREGAATSPGPGSISRPWRRSCRGCVSTSSIPIKGACRCILE